MDELRKSLKRRLKSNGIENDQYPILAFQNQL
jgi:hypothetical protein